MGRREVDPVPLLRLVAVPLRRWKIVFATALMFVGVALLVLLLQPRSYMARTVLVPSPDQSGSRAALLTQGQLPASLAGLMMGSNSNQRLVAGVMRSRTLADSLILRLGIDPETEKAEAGEVRALLAGRTRTESNPDGSIVITVRDRDPVLAAQIANEFPSLINGTLSRISSHAAMQKQEFLERQIMVAHERLLDSEEQLIAFQVLRDAPEGQEQARRTLEAAATLQQRIIEQEIAVAQLRRTATPSNPELQAAVAALGQWRAQLARLTSGESRSDQVFLPIRESPELRVAANRLLREFTKNEQVFNSLTAALAETQIDVNNNLPVVSVLDPAVVPEFPSSFNRSLLLGMALLLGLFAGVVGALGKEYFAFARRDPGSEPFFVAIDDLKAEVRGWRPGRRSLPNAGSAPSERSSRPEPDQGFLLDGAASEETRGETADAR